MRIAVLSDIHSNYIALEACMDYLEHHKVEKIIFLGDNVSDCPKPEITLQLIRQIDKNIETSHIRGNREEYFIDHEDGKSDNWTYSSYQGSLLYTYEHLTREDITCFRYMKNHRIIQFPGMEDIMIVHGSSNTSRELLHAYQDNTNHYLEQMPVKYLLGGHTHRPTDYYYKGKRLINPGSVGVGIGTPKCAQIVILEWKNKEWIPEFIDIPYDFTKVEAFFYASSLMEKAFVWPKCILKSMETGVNVGPLCAKAAYDMAVADQYHVEKGIIPEKYWNYAARQLGVI